MGPQCLGSVMYGCRQCNYDMCSACYDLQGRLQAEQLKKHQITKACSHVLKRFVTERLGFKCDFCSRFQTSGCVMFGCRQCNYDVCSGCLASAGKPAGGSHSNACVKHVGVNAHAQVSQVPVPLEVVRRTSVPSV